MCYVNNRNVGDWVGNIQPYSPHTPPWTNPQPLILPQIDIVGNQTGTHNWQFSGPLVVVPSFIGTDEGYELVLSLLGYDRDSVSVKLIHSNISELAITATNGGLDGKETFNKTFKLPKDANFAFDVVLLNGVLTIKTGLMEVNETKLEIK